MIGFLGGVIAGAILGVIADRLWRRYEGIIRVRAVGGYFKGIAGEEGFTFTIKNKGREAIPDYSIALYHPKRGTLFAFLTESTGVLLPGQKREHRCALIKYGKVDGRLLGWFTPDAGEKAGKDGEAKCVFRLVMKDSDTVLYENATIGNALESQFLKIGHAGTDKDVTWEEAMALQTPERQGILNWLGQVCRYGKNKKGTHG